jgi:chloride channel 3/4/5
LAQQTPHCRSPPRAFISAHFRTHRELILSIEITAITTILSFINGYTLMGGTEFVYNLFAMCLPGSPNTHEGLCVLDPGKQTFYVIRMIAVAMVLKAALTVVTFGIKLPAGIFIPTLGVGACAGRIVGLAVQYAQWRWPAAPIFSSCKPNAQCVIPGLYAMVGAAATLSGVTRTTVSLAVIMFELTDTLTYAVPVMLAVLVAKTVADSLEPKGIYELVIEYVLLLPASTLSRHLQLSCVLMKSRLSQLPYLNAKHQYLWGAFTVSDAVRSQSFFLLFLFQVPDQGWLSPQMDREVEVIKIGHSNTVRTLRDQLARLVATGYADTGFPIIRTDGDRESQLLGFIGANELEHALSTSSSTCPVHLCAGSLMCTFVWRPFFSLFSFLQASSRRRQIIPYPLNRIAGVKGPFLLHPSRLSSNTPRIHSTSAYTWIRYMSFPAKSFPSKPFLFG